MGKQSNQSQRSRAKVPSACQRCRRQKLKCDVHRPCILCARAGVRCLSDMTTRWKAYQPTAAEEGRSPKRARIPASPSAQNVIPSPSNSGPNGLNPGAPGPSTHRNAPLWNSSSTMSLVDGLTILWAFEFHNATTPGNPVASAIPGGRPQEVNLESSSDNEVSRPPTQGNGAGPQTMHSLGHASSVFTELVSLLPSFEAASLLVDTYFDRAHWFMLIFHQDEFRQRWPKLYEPCSGSPTKRAHWTGFTSTCLMVIAIGMHYAGSYRQELLATHGVDQNLKGRILCSIRARLLDIVSLGSLEAVQTCILLGTYYLYHGAPSLAWPVCGCGLRIAQALGLHRKLEPSHDPNFRLQNETRKRCWWAIYEIETFCAVSYGYPHNIRDADCDVEPLDPSAKLPIVQPPSSFDEPLMCETTLLSYKYFMSKLSVITKGALGELYRIEPQSVVRRTQYQKSLDLPGMIKKVTDFDHRLCQWHAELPPKLQWNCQGPKTNYRSVKDLDRDIGAFGSRFENHIYQLQALTLMLAHGNSRILVNRPLLSYKLIAESSTGKHGINGPDFAASNPLNLSLTACRDAALSMSEIASSSIVDLVSETYAAEFVSTHTFTAGVTLGILASMDPLSPHLNGVKHGLRQLMRVQEKLKAGSILAGQGLGILQRLTKLAVEKELNVLLDVSNPTESGLSTDHREASENVQSDWDTSNAVQISQEVAPAAGEPSIPPPVAGSVDIDDMFDGSSFQYMEDPALSGALYDFDQALSICGPRAQADNDEDPTDPFFGPSIQEGFSLLEQTWFWGLDNIPFNSGPDS